MQLSALAMLLEHRARVDAQETTGLQPLHIAVLSGKNEMVSQLLKLRAQADARGQDTSQPIHLGSNAGHIAVVKTLLDQDSIVDVESKASSAMQPLHFAALTGHVEMTSLLLERTAHIDGRTIEGLEALHLAVRGGHVSVTTLLLDRGARFDTYAKTGVRPCDVALDGNHHECGSLLKDAADAICLRRRALDEQGRLIDLAAVETFKAAREKCESLQLHRLAAEIAAEESFSEFRLERWQECVGVCRLALSAKPPLSSTGELKLRFREALENIKNPPKREQKSTEPLIDATEFSMFKIGPVMEEANSPTDIDALRRCIVEVTAERDNALAIVEEQAAELAALRMQLAELRSKCVCSE